MLVNLFTSLSIIGVTVLIGPIRGERLEVPGLVELVVKGGRERPHVCLLGLLVMRLHGMN